MQPPNHDYKYNNNRKMQNDKKYGCRKFGDCFVVSIANHSEICEVLTEFCKDHNVNNGVIEGLGAVNEATLRFFNPATKAYVDRTFTGQMEIANLTGNISAKDGQPYLHLHVTLGCEDYTAIAGHLLCATLSGAGEFVVRVFDGELDRKFDETLGLNVYDL